MGTLTLPLLLATSSSLSSSTSRIPNHQYHGLRDLSPRSKEVISGLSAGILTTIVNHPLDLIKVRLQLDYNSKTQLKSFQNIVKNLVGTTNSVAATSTTASSTSANLKSSKKFHNAFKNLYRGLSINLIGNAFSWSLYFTLYNDMKNLGIVPNHVARQHPQFNYLVSSFVAGSVTALISNPIWVLKTRLLSTNKNFPNAYKSILDGVSKILKNESFGTFFKGFTPGLVSVCQGSFYFTIYDSLKHYHLSKLRLTNANTNGDLVKEKNICNHKFTFYEYLYITSISKVISTTVFYPFQLFKSRLQSYNFQLVNLAGEQQPVAHVAKSAHGLKLRTIIKETYVKEGMRGFYKGLYINLFRTLPATCITFLTYEHIKNFLQ